MQVHSGIRLGVVYAHLPGPGLFLRGHAGPGREPWCAKEPRCSREDRGDIHRRVHRLAPPGERTTRSADRAHEEWVHGDCHSAHLVAWPGPCDRSCAEAVEDDPVQFDRVGTDP
jgi:hypothetical protein